MPLTPKADTTIRVSGTLVAQDPMADPDKGDALTCFDEYEIQYGGDLALLAW